MENFGELLGVVSENQKFRSVNVVEDVFPVEQAVSQLGIGERDEGVQLRLAGLLAANAASDHDPAGADIQTNGLTAVLSAIRFRRFRAAFHGRLPFPGGGSVALADYGVIAETGDRSGQAAVGSRALRRAEGSG